MKCYSTEKARKKALEDMSLVMMVAVSTVLWDKLNFGKPKIQQTIKQIMRKFEDISEERVSLKDLQTTLYEEAGISFKQEENKVLNSVIMMGRLTADPQERQTQNGNAFTAFTIAVERAFAGKGEERPTDFFDVIAWGKAGEFSLKYFKKGQLVAIQGHMETRTYEDKNGVKRKGYTIIAEHLHFAEPKRSTEQINTKENNTEASDNIDDDFPF